MPKFAANLSMLFNEYDFLDRFAAARQCGFHYVEYLFPYTWQPELLRQKLDEHGLTQVLFNLPPGSWEAGDRGLACDPARREAFRAGVAEALRYAERLGVRQLNCLAGLVQGIDPAQAWDTLLGNLSYAAEELACHDIRLLIEPINSRVDMPGYLVDTLDKALRVLHEVNHPNLKIQFDLYHMQIMQGDLIRSIEQYLPDIAHIQFADNPGRHEPGTGEINFEMIFKRLDELGYDGWVSAEYRPSMRTEQTLQWLQSFN